MSSAHWSVYTFMAAMNKNRWDWKGIRGSFHITLIPSYSLERLVEYIPVPQGFRDVLAVAG